MGANTIQNSKQNGTIDRPITNKRITEIKQIQVIVFWLTLILFLSGGVAVLLNGFS